MDVSQYLEIFIDETKEHLQTLSDQLMILETEPDNMETINEIFRAAHSLKGMAGTMGYKRMQRLTHDMENVFQEIRSGNMKVQPELIDVCLLYTSQDESTFFGAMDGASKYVKGDATAGLIITVINFVGGLAIGVMSQGLEMTEALQKYSILTIGDGLVSQIPSLVISLSTGVLVTKVSKESDLGNVLITQLFSTPKVLYIVGATMALLGLTPLPTLICFIYAILFIAAGRAIESAMEVQNIETEVDEEEETAEEIRRPENVVSLLQVDPIELE